MLVHTEGKTQVCPLHLLPAVCTIHPVLIKAIEKGDISELTKLDPSIFNTDWRQVESKIKELKEQTQIIATEWISDKEIAIFFKHSKKI